MMIDREHVFGLRNEVGRDVRDITRNRGPGACNTEWREREREREGARWFLGGGSERTERVKEKKTAESVRPKGWQEDRRKLRRK